MTGYPPRQVYSDTQLRGSTGDPILVANESWEP
jgi:hypothetical protein